MTSTGVGRKAVGLLLAASLAVTGCSSTGNGPGSDNSVSSSSGTTGGEPLTEDEKQLRADADTFNTTVVEGSLVGAGIGILAGVLIGATTGRVDNMVRYGIAGGLAGGILGGVDGYMTAKRQEAGNNRVRMLQSMTRDVEADNQRAQAAVDTSTRVLTDSKQQLDEINQQAAAKQTSLDQARAQKHRVEENRDAMQATLSALKKRRDNYAGAAQQTGGDTRDLDRQIAELDQQIRKLESNVAEMNQALAVSRV